MLRDSVGRIRKQGIEIVNTTSSRPEQRISPVFQKNIFGV